MAEKQCLIQVSLTGRCVHLEISQTSSKFMCTLSELSGIVIISSQLWCCSVELDLSFWDKWPFVQAGAGRTEQPSLGDQTGLMWCKETFPLMQWSRCQQLKHVDAEYRKRNTLIADEQGEKSKKLLWWCCWFWLMNTAEQCCSCRENKIRFHPAGFKLALKCHYIIR